MTVAWDVALLCEDPVRLRPEVQEDVEEIGGLEVGGDGDSETTFLEDLLDLLPFGFQGPAFQIGGSEVIIAVKPQVEVGLGKLVQHVQPHQLADLCAVEASHGHVPFAPPFDPWGASDVQQGQVGLVDHVLLLLGDVDQGFSPLKGSPE